MTAPIALTSCPVQDCSVRRRRGRRPWRRKLHPECAAEGQPVEGPGSGRVILLGHWWASPRGGFRGGGPELRFACEPGLFAEAASPSSVTGANRRRSAGRRRDRDGAGRPRLAHRRHRRSPHRCRPCPVAAADPAAGVFRWQAPLICFILIIVGVCSYYALVRGNRRDAGHLRRRLHCGRLREPLEVAACLGPAGLRHDLVLAHPSATLRPDHPRLDRDPGPGPGAWASWSAPDGPTPPRSARWQSGWTRPGCAEARQAAWQERARLAWRAARPDRAHRQRTGDSGRRRPPHPGVGSGAGRAGVPDHRIDRREALEELDRLLGILTETDEPDLPPQPRPGAAARAGGQ